MHLGRQWADPCLVAIPLRSGDTGVTAPSSSFFAHSCRSSTPDPPPPHHHNPHLPLSPVSFLNSACPAGFLHAFYSFTHSRPLSFLCVCVCVCLFIFLRPGSSEPVVHSMRLLRLLRVKFVFSEFVRSLL